MQVIRSEWQENPRPIENGKMVIAIGDVHGCSKHLAKMYEYIAEDVESLIPNNITCILIGDLIDRGENSLECLILATQGLSSYISKLNVKDIVLKGNHDLWLCNALNGQLNEKDFQSWMRNGGKATLTSLGVPPGLSIDTLQKSIKNCLPIKTRLMLKNMQDNFKIEQLLFVHAGIDPKYHLTNQTQHSMLWIREEFLNPTYWPFNEIVIHGHTIECFLKKPKIYSHRIGIDTGAYVTEILTAIEFLGSEMRFLMVKPAD
jgi:serine/threonine protein phosphatase 1